MLDDIHKLGIDYIPKYTKVNYWKWGCNNTKYYYKCYRNLDLETEEFRKKAIKWFLQILHTNLISYKNSIITIGSMNRTHKHTGVVWEKYGMSYITIITPFENGCIPLKYYLVKPVKHS